MGPAARQQGEYILTLDFDTGTNIIQLSCRFNVIPVLELTPTLAPVVNLWLDPGQCGAQFGPGDPIGIHVWTNQNGKVELGIRPMYATSGGWEPIGRVSSLDVKAEQEANLGWQAPQGIGSYTLRASLNGGVAEATCDLQVVDRTPPTIQEINLAPQLPCDSQMVQVTVRAQDIAGIASIELYQQSVDTGEFLNTPGTRVDDTTYQFTIFASIEKGTQFYMVVQDGDGNQLSTQDNPNQAWSGFIETGAYYDQYCAAYLILPKTDLPTMDLPDMPIYVDTLQACIADCNYDLTCQSFTYDASNYTCWLKNGVPTAMPKEVCTSGIKFSVSIP